MPVPITPLRERLIARIRIDADGCWIFAGATSDGYGVLGRGGRGAGNVYAHRASYEIFIGPIPVGLHIDHLCRVRACIRPSHLEAVTQAENNRRAIVVRAANNRKRAAA